MADPVTNTAVQPQLVQNESENPQLAEPATNSVAQTPSPISIDSVSKALAVVLVLVYVAGFLITSLHSFKYGFSEVNPLHPRILAAGGWFAIFIGVPFALVWELRKHSVWKDKRNSISKLATILAAYMSSSVLLAWVSGFLFVFDGAQVSLSTPPPFPWWKIVLFVLGFLVVLAVFVFVFALLKSKLPDWATTALIFIFYGWIVFFAYYDLFAKNAFTFNSMYFWLFAAGGFSYLEFNARKWTLKGGDWDRVMVGLLFLLTIFATVYYPHIMAKWGGGALIPMEITFSNNPSVQIGCDLIDETDAGFYVIGRGEPSATFIPRTVISSIYYGQRNGHSVFAEELLPQQTRSLPPSNPQPNQPATMQATPYQKPVSATSPH
jgi:hypothetical protein